MTTTTITKWGNSQGIRLNKALLETVNLTENDLVNIIVDDGKLIIMKAEVKQPRKTIQELFEGYNNNHIATEIDWGEPKGDEVW